MKPTLLLVKEVAQELGVGVHLFDVHTGKDIPRIESAKCCGPIWNESNGFIRRKVYRGLREAVNALTRRRQPAARTATTPQASKTGAFMADGRSGNFYHEPGF